LLDQGSETEAASLLRKMGSSLGGQARELAYRLFKVCERKGWSAEAQVYNGLVLAWPELTKLARTEAATQQFSVLQQNLWVFL
jgi:putative DNA methylase